MDKLLLTALLLSGCYSVAPEATMLSCADAQRRVLDLGCVTPGWVSNFEALYIEQCELAGGIDNACLATAESCDDAAECVEP